MGHPEGRSDQVLPVQPASQKRYGYSGRHACVINGWFPGEGPWDRRRHSMATDRHSQIAISSIKAPRSRENSTRMRLLQWQANPPSGGVFLSRAERALARGGPTHRRRKLTEGDVASAVASEPEQRPANQESRRCGRDARGRRESRESGEATISSTAGSGLHAKTNATISNWPCANSRG
jgi:hypothetical protein